MSFSIIQGTKGISFGDSGVSLPNMLAINFQSIMLAVLVAARLQVANAEAVPGAYIYHRHNDHTPEFKSYELTVCFS
jgi:hypothetical protein